MKKIYLLIILMLGSFFSLRAQDETTSNELIDTLSVYNSVMDSINSSFNFKRGVVDIGDGLAQLNLPEGFKYLDEEQSKHVLTELWGNPPSETLGMIFPESSFPVGDFEYAVEISYAEDGYVDDEDAESIDYDELLADMQSDIEDSNPSRKEQGYPAYELVGWAASPYYDAENKKLHWAQELKFEGSDINTLNYNIRILGRKGYLVLNAIGDIEALKAVDRDSERILASVDFSDGNKYSDFNPDIDKVAAYGIGGLVAGKVLAKTGVLAILAKFGKFIIVGIAGVFAMLRKKFFGGGDSEEA
ncbi:DUF2167 domain-containing protein [Aureibacter tunicatorum]|uniref:Membrane-anchored protein n=1 Tax=Aureibacter tunicatorum TaxID=866807 RepID=A0AAE3XLE8_9BACT|nr:DUF2167 domain-containing protein [Aureibacter tunicatorum]MDR6237931.1 putative membrane-anchored protein [Aureibacter tunicatorum]BDD02964.1 hypothetical protein AUTU_04470 [Aureibacter tunicatorum]